MGESWGEESPGICLDPDLLDETNADLIENKNVEEKSDYAVVEDNPDSNGDIWHFTEHYSYSHRA